MAQVIRALLFGLVLTCASGLGHAGSAVHAASFHLWAELTPQQQTALAPIATDWNNLPATQQEKLLKIAQGYARLTPRQQQVLQSRLAVWARMTPEQRKVARANYKKLLALPARTQIRVKQGWAEARGHAVDASAPGPGASTP